MFWGLALQAGKQYTQLIERSFHVSMAALGLDSDSEEPVSVCVEQNKCLFILCTLKAGHNYQQLLNLNFTEGEEVTFSIEGNREVHLTGYVHPEPKEYEVSIDDDCQNNDMKADCTLSESSIDSDNENSNTIGRVAKEWGVENVLTKNNSSKEATSKDSITVGSNSEAAKKMSVDLKVTSKRVEECQNKHRIKKRKIC